MPDKFPFKKTLIKYLKIGWPLLVLVLLAATNLRFYENIFSRNFEVLVLDVADLSTQDLKYIDGVETSAANVASNSDTAGKTIPLNNAAIHGHSTTALHPKIENEKLSTPHFAVALKSVSSDNELLTAQSSDPRWSVVKSGLCASVTLYPAPPWNFRSYGSYNDARIMRLYECNDKDSATTTKAR